MDSNSLGRSNMDSSNAPTLAIQGFTPYAQVPRWVLRAGGKLSHGAVRLYGVIMTYADNTDHAAFPGQDRLARDLGVSSRSIRTYMVELETYGALRVTRRRNKRTGNFYSNHYVLIFADPSEAHFRPSPEADVRRTTSTTTTPTTHSPTESASPTGDAEPSLREHHAGRDAAALTDLAVDMLEDGCADPSAFLDAFDALYPLGSQDAAHLIVNCWGPDETTRRLGAEITKAQIRGADDPVRYGCKVWAHHKLPGITGHAAAA